jgi:hypothetical protein
MVISGFNVEGNTVEHILFRLHTKCDSEEIVDPDWLNDFSSQYVCPGCKNIYNNVRQSSMDIVLRKRPSVAALDVLPPDINIARRDFMDLFFPEASRFLKIGKVIFKDGTILNDFVTFSGDRRIPLRGDSGSRLNDTCTLCGYIRYWPQYPWYVLSKDYFEQPIYESWSLNGLVVSSELKDRIVKGKWKGIYITKLPIIDEPRDGIELPDPLIV